MGWVLGCEKEKCYDPNSQAFSSRDRGLFKISRSCAAKVTTKRSGRGRAYGKSALHGGICLSGVILECEKGRFCYPNSQEVYPRDKGGLKISLSGAGRSPARRARLCRAPELLRCGSDDKAKRAR